MRLLLDALAPGTVDTYQAGFEAYAKFCGVSGARFPPSSGELLAFATHQHQGGLSRSRVQRLVLGVRNACVESGESLTPFADPRLARLYLGMDRQEGAARPRPREPAGKAPFTPELLSRAIRDLGGDRVKDRALQAALALAFFGLLRAGEVTFKPERRVAPLTRKSVAWHPDHVEITLHATKTDRRRRGVVVKLFPSGGRVCPYALLRCAWDRSPVVGPEAAVLQADDDGRPLSYRDLLDCVKQCVARAGLNVAAYGTHSLRAGGASLMAQRGFGDLDVRAMGRWSSTCFQRYIRFGNEFHQNVARELGAAMQ